MSRTFSMNSGSSEILKDSTTCGCNPKVRQMRPTVEALTPACSAILRVLQWVRPFGLLSNVVTRIDSTSASDRVRGAPGLGSSSSASTRPTLNRCRHVPTVTFEQRSFAATARFEPRVLLRTSLPASPPIRSGRLEQLKCYALRRAISLWADLSCHAAQYITATHYLKLFQTR